MMTATLVIRTTPVLWLCLVGHSLTSIRAMRVMTIVGMRTFSVSEDRYDRCLACVRVKVPKVLSNRAVPGIVLLVISRCRFTMTVLVLLSWARLFVKGNLLRLMTAVHRRISLVIVELSRLLITFVRRTRLMVDRSLPVNCRLKLCRVR